MAGKMKGRMRLPNQVPKINFDCQEIALFGQHLGSDTCLYCAHNVQSDYLKIPKYDPYYLYLQQMEELKQKEEQEKQQRLKENPELKQQQDEEEKKNLDELEQDDKTRSLSKQESLISEKEEIFSIDSDDYNNDNLLFKRFKHCYCCKGVVKFCENCVQIQGMDSCVCFQMYQVEKNI
ncbi:hypothetical protein PPERSA_01266 [Pseudocohnilembus persalinus]|uniref:Uncharacterized protein n=1 Tax=Pseudocohnilembus persalinus TaxID=266149 RepID=A0A0V0QGG0_PSEPJ|nr:hypothetical protein PPERSA_01266 [Pseudocohnilembus persalinus]|eukprot:KRX01363.1 hypothetical protein PPERSA_01266 [Pseudocohnilembus persalinus]